MAESTIEPGKTKNQRLVRKHDAIANGLRITRDAVTGEGEVQHSVFEVTFDGRDYRAIEGTDRSTTAITRTDRRTLEVTVTRPNGAQIHQHTVVSADGNTLTVTESGVAADGTVANHFSVLEKQP